MNKIIGILLICTGKYDIFLQRLIDSLETHFFKDDEIIIYLFWDKAWYKLNLPSRFSVICIPIIHKPFPFPTLYRYKYFTNAAEKIKSNYTFYLDVDMLLVGDVGHKILPQENEGGLVATGHPGFWNGGGSWCNEINSTAYTQENNRAKYCAGGFQGGETKKYLSVCEELSKNIDVDLSKGIIAEWHDESHWNRYLSTHKYKLLTPEYCMIPEENVRIKYGINHYAPRIIALTKNHEELR